MVQDDKIHFHGPRWDCNSNNSEISWSVLIITGLTGGSADSSEDDAESTKYVAENLKEKYTNQITFADLELGHCSERKEWKDMPTLYSWIPCKFQG